MILLILYADGNTMNRFIIFLLKFQYKYHVNNKHTSKNCVFCYVQPSLQKKLLNYE